MNKGFLIAVAIFFSFGARAGEIFLEGGLVGGNASSKNSSGRSQYNLWGFTAGANYKSIWTQNTGPFVGAEWMHADLLNESGTFIERGTMDRYAGKLGYFLGNFTLGGTYSTDKLNLRLFPQTSEPQKGRFQGRGYSAFLNWTSSESKDVQPSIEAQIFSTDYSNFRITGWTLHIKVQIRLAK